jgi:hypothetical protein
VHAELVEAHFDHKCEEIADTCGVDTSDLRGKASAHQLFAQWRLRFSTGRAATGKAGPLRDAVEFERNTEAVAEAIPGRVPARPRDLDDERRRMNHQKLATYRSQHGRIHDGRPIGAQLQEEAAGQQRIADSRRALCRSDGRDGPLGHAVVADYRKASLEARGVLAGSCAAVDTRSGKRSSI